MPYKDPEQKRACDARYNAGHREERRIASAAWRKANPEKVKAGKIAYEAANREKVQASKAARHVMHRDKDNARSAIRRAAHLEEEKARSAAWYAAHHEEAKAYAVARRAAHPEVNRAAVKRRRAKKKGLPATLTAEQWEAIKKAYKHRCAYCGNKGTQQNPLTQDHVVPIAKDGGSIPENIVPACRSCNSRKRAGPAPIIPPIRLMV